MARRQWDWLVGPAFPMTGPPPPKAPTPSEYLVKIVDDFVATNIGNPDLYAWCCRLQYAHDLYVGRENQHFGAEAREFVLREHQQNAAART